MVLKEQLAGMTREESLIITKFELGRNIRREGNSDELPEKAGCLSPSSVLSAEKRRQKTTFVFRTEKKYVLIVTALTIVFVSKTNRSMNRKE